MAPILSYYSLVNDLCWKPTRGPIVDRKVLMEEKSSDLMTALIRQASGAELPMHEHVESEQSWVLQGEFEDDEGTYTAGNFVWQPAGHCHVAQSPKGALVLCFSIEIEHLRG